MILRSRKLPIVGLTLIAIALLTMVVASLYVWLAPRTYSAHVILTIPSASRNGAPIRFEDLPLESFRQNRNLQIEKPRNITLFRIRAFASTPDEAVEHANKSARELEANVRSLLKADVFLIEPAERNPRPVRPNTKAILALCGFPALNLAFLGLVLFLAGLVATRLSRADAVPAQEIA